MYMVQLWRVVLISPSTPHSGRIICLPYLPISERLSREAIAPNLHSGLVPRLGRERGYPVKIGARNRKYSPRRHDTPLP